MKAARHRRELVGQAVDQIRRIPWSNPAMSPMENDDPFTRLWGAFEFLQKGMGYDTSSIRVPSYIFALVLRRSPSGQVHRIPSITSHPGCSSPGRHTGRLWRDVRAPSERRSISRALRLMTPTSPSEGSSPESISTDSVLGHTAWRDRLLHGLIHHISDVSSDHACGSTWDRLLERFAEQSGLRGGEYFTPLSVTKLMAERRRRSRHASVRPGVRLRIVAGGLRARRERPTKGAAPRTGD